MKKEAPAREQKKVPPQPVRKAQPVKSRPPQEVRTASIHHVAELGYN